MTQNKRTPQQPPLRTAGQPMTGESMKEFMLNSNITSLDLQWLTGMFASAYTAATQRKNASTMLSLPSRGVLMRLLLERPELSPLFETPSPLDVLECIKRIPGYETMPASELTVLLGLGYGAITRYEKGGRPSKITERLLNILWTQLNRKDTTQDDKIEFLKFYKSVVYEEARCRGISISDVEQNGFRRYINQNIKIKRVRKVPAAKKAAPAKKTSKSK